jgi:PAS domain-containing protein
VIQLAAVAGSHTSSQVGEEEVGFCSYCGRLDGNGHRVCPSCGLGVLLRTHPGALKIPGAAFVIVRTDGKISAVSQAAERMLARQEDLVGRPLLSLLTGVDLARSVAITAAGHGGPFTLDVERIGGGRLRAIVATCHDPSAALVVLERP